MVMPIPKAGKDIQCGNEATAAKYKRNVIDQTQLTRSNSLDQTEFAEVEKTYADLEIDIEEAEVPLGTTCCGFLPSTHPVRMKIFWLVHTEAFINGAVILIILSCIQLAWETYATTEWEDKMLLSADYAFTTLFFFEMVLKMLSDGVWDNDHAYFKSAANKLDFLIVVLGVVSTASAAIFDGLSLHSVRALRALRCVRPLRIITRSESMMHITRALFSSTLVLIYISLLQLCILLVFGIMGCQLFRGTSSSFCNDTSVENSSACTGTFIREGRLIPREWLSTTANFDNVGASILTLFEVSSLEGWSAYMFFYMKSTGYEVTSCFFLLWIGISSYFMLNLFAGVIFTDFVRATEGESGFSRLHKFEQDWLISARSLLLMNPTTPTQPPSSVVRHLLFDVVTTPFFEKFIGSMIVANSCTLCWHFWPEPIYWTETLQVFEWYFGFIFLVEALFKIGAFGFSKYFECRWNQYDFVLVSASIIDTVAYLSQTSVNVGWVRILRIFRIFRLCRLAKHMQLLHNIISILLVSIPTISMVGVLLLIILFSFGIMGHHLFENVPIGAEGITRHANFKNIGISMLTLFRISTGEDWHLIMHSCIDEQPILAPFYFISFGVISTLVILNVFVACLADNMKV